MANKSYRYVGEVPGSLASGRPVEPGEFVELTKEEQGDEYNKGLITEGQLIEATDAQTKEGS